MTKINREAFLHELESLTPGLSSSEILPQGNCFVFQNGRVYTYNDEVISHRKTIIGDSFQGVIQAKNLMAFLRKVKIDEISLEGSDEAIIINGKNEKASFRLEQEIMFPTGMLEKPKKAIPISQEFLDAISTVSSCTNKKGVIEHSSIHIHPEWIEASDNFQVCRWTMDTGISKSTLVKSIYLEHISKLNMIQMGETSGFVHFRNKDGVTLSCRSYQEKYRDYTKVFQMEGNKFKLPNNLGDVIAKADIFSRDSEGDNLISIQLKPKEISISGTGINGRYDKWGKVDYDGDPITFLISPDMLRKIVEKYQECEVVPGRLKVSGDKWVYVACLINPRFEGDEND